ncbi:hypothetical protein [Nonomuraea sp. NPDC059022]
MLADRLPLVIGEIATCHQEGLLDHPDCDPNSEHGLVLTHTTALGVLALPGAAQAVAGVGAGFGIGVVTAIMGVAGGQVLISRGVRSAVGEGLIWFSMINNPSSDKADHRCSAADRHRPRRIRAAQQPPLGLSVITLLTGDENPADIK